MRNTTESISYKVKTGLMALCCTLALSICLTTSVPAAHASSLGPADVSQENGLTAQTIYPWLFGKFYGETFEVGHFQLEYNVWSDYKYNRYDVQIIRVSDGETIATADGSINHYNSSLSHLTLNVDASDWEPGEYKSVASMTFYSYYNWNESPRGETTTYFNVVRNIERSRLTLSPSSFTYSGKVQRPSLDSVTIGDDELTNGTDYKVKYSNSKSKEVGKYKVWIVGKGYYKGTSAKALYKIKKAANPMTLKAKTTTVASSKKNQTINNNKVLSIKKAAGTITFEKIGGSKQLSVYKSGNILLKKSTKPGRYKVKVKVTASGNENYKALSKKATLTVVVK